MNQIISWTWNIEMLWLRWPFLSVGLLHTLPWTENNGQKTRQLQFHFSGEAFIFLFFLLIWTSEIIQFIDIQSRWTGLRGLIFFGEKVDFLSNFAIVGYGHFPTRNGLKLRKLSTWHCLRINNVRWNFYSQTVSIW